MKKAMDKKTSERGSATVKMLLFLLIIILAANASLNYIPVAYEGENLKQEMETAVIQGSAIMTKQTTPVDAVKNRLHKYISYGEFPEDIIFEVNQKNNVVQAHIYYSRQVNILPFGIYKYDYIFDYTARPMGFLIKE